MTPRWIGFSGKMYAGKDYAYDYLRDQNYDVERVSFADQLRLEIRDTLGLATIIRKPYTDLERKLQQWWGTEYRRSQDPDYWVNKAREAAKEATGVPVFTDVRFPNEADMIREEGGLIVRLEAREVTRKDRGRVNTLPNHESETAMDDYEFDYVVLTDHTEGRYEDGMEWVAMQARLW